MEFKGTKGEWILNTTSEDYEYTANILIDSEGGFHVCEMIGGLPKNEYTANAKLIAAAPELLNALKEMLYMTGGSVRFSNGVCKTIEEAEQLAVQAIKKAIG